MSARRNQGEGPRGGPQQVTAGGRYDPSPAKSAGSGASVHAIRSVSRALDSGDRRQLLVALRDKLWAAFHDERTQPRDLSPLTLRLKEIQAEIESLDLRESSGPAVAVDEVFDPRSV